MAVAALLAFLSPSYWLYYAAIVGSVVAVSKARITRICVKITIVYHTCYVQASGELQMRQMLLLYFYQITLLQSLFPLMHTSC